MATRKTRTPQAVSLFSGAGGLDVGLERAGWDVVSATDFAADAMATLRGSQAAKLPIRGQRGVHLTGTKLVEADVSELDAAELKPSKASVTWRPDLLAGGPPCQPWSSAGHQKGLDDSRGQLIAHMIRLIGDLNPRYVLFENVRGLVTALGRSGNPGEVLRSIQNDLRDLGFASRIATLNAADYGAAQRRVRLFLIATADHVLPDFPVPTHSRNGENGRKPWVSLGELLDSLQPAEDDLIVRPAGMRGAELRQLTPGTGVRTAGRVMNNRPSGQWGYRQDSFLADLTLPSRTIRAATTPDWIRLPSDNDLRRLTWKECAALQGFPTDWSFQGSTGSLFKQIGNAVQVDMAEVIGRCLLDALSHGEAVEPPTMPPWPAELLKRVKYTEAEHRVNGELRTRIRPKAQSGKLR